MPLCSSIPITSEQFDSLILYLRENFGADLFLASQAYPQSGKSYICVNPLDELNITAKTGRGEISDFCFNDDNLSFGFLAYNYGQTIRGIQSSKSTEFPYGHIKKYAIVISFDGKILELTNYKQQDSVDLDFILLAISGTTAVELLPKANEIAIQQSLSHTEYVNNTRRILDYIRDGYTYQLNLTIKYNTHINNLDTNNLFYHFWKKYPASHYVLFESGDYQIISTSPERFLRVTDGQVLSQPIKGTLEFDTWDESLTQKLTGSPKESAELSMIVDMVRNDISANCEIGSITVENHKSTFQVDNLLQMYSNVSGQLLEDRTVVDLLFDAFPGASITGCPKLKAMELIDELEPHSRDVYCGSFFVISDKKNIESSIAIRTGYYNTITEQLSFFAGSGIVVESIPENEYLETTAKAKKFLDFVQSK